MAAAVGDRIPYLCSTKHKNSPSSRRFSPEGPARAFERIQEVQGKNKFGLIELAVFCVYCGLIRSAGVFANGRQKIEEGEMNDRKVRLVMTFGVDRSVW
jgi:hypothetical protein